MLLATTQGVHALVDSFSGALLRTFSDPNRAADEPPPQQPPLEACFSPDAELVLAGAHDGSILRWETRTAKMLPAMREHLGPVGALKCSPTRMMLASADTATCLWLPDQQ